MYRNGPEDTHAASHGADEHPPFDPSTPDPSTPEPSTPGPAVPAHAAVMEVSDDYVAATSYTPGTPWSPATLQGPTITAVDAVDVATSFHADAPAVVPAAVVTENGPAWTTTTAAAVMSSHQEVTCPDCGQTTAISINRRESADFCPHCDYPLFWIVTNVVIDSTSAQSGSLRRLPGTAGRAHRAGVECPTCDELNSPTALVCTRCGGPMKLPAPVFEEPPPPPPPALEPLWAPEPEEARRNLLWLWIVLGVVGVGVVAWVTVGLLNVLIG